ncbi:MAG TPA: orotate phosphoribosyltransferase [Flavobacteriales bacterium]|nr:orotate phosphoribosyltransferase [Flavobacteriales bacterium]
MVINAETASELSRFLLQIKAIQIQTANPFHWASGWLSPIYCDNRKTLSHPNIRNFVKNELKQVLLNEHSNVEVIAGVATGAIAIGALVADIMDLPFIYVRSSSKGHGLGNQIEGDLSVGKKVVVIEDLISTGMSSLNAVKCLRDAGMEVLGMASIFTYGFDQATDNFKDEACSLISLADYSTLLEVALQEKYIHQDEMEVLKNWRKDPSNWKGK